MQANSRKNKKPKVLFVTSEIHPLIKTGGLADVSAALPVALRTIGVDVRVLVPGYPRILSSVKNKRKLARIIDIPGHGEVNLLSAKIPGCDVPIIIVDYPAFYERTGGPYSDKSGLDWPDNALRFGLLSRIAALLGSDANPLTWKPDIVHCNDWQTGLAPAYLHFAKGPKAATVMTVHNLAYQGIFPSEIFPQLNLPEACFNMHGVEYYGNISFLKAGLYYANHLTTVSPTYAKEIQSEALGFGLQGLLAERANQLTGILNGVDAEHWNPACDTHLATTYSPTRLNGKKTNKQALQKQLNLPVSADIPLFGVVSRITHQKGLDLLLEILPSIVREPAQIILLGTGELELEQAFLLLGEQYPNHFRAVIGFDEGLSHQVEAGADIFLMPSRFEPCGLNQMYSMLYGTPPIVTPTGGLADTVVDLTPSSLKDGSATGFMLQSFTATNLLQTVKRAIEAYHDKKTWRKVQLNGMRRDFGWTKSAETYLSLYLSLIQK